MDKKTKKSDLPGKPDIRAEVFDLVAKETDTPTANLDDDTVLGLGGAGVADDEGLQGLVDALNRFIENRGKTGDLTTDDITLESTLREVVTTVQARL